VLLTDPNLCLSLTL
jgi:hypothetical protein